MAMFAAALFAVANEREEIAAISANSHFCMAGITRRVAMLAVLRIPHFTLRLMMSLA
jgi:hypothetical protein